MNTIMGRDLRPGDFVCEIDDWIDVGLPWLIVSVRHVPCSVNDAVKAVEVYMIDINGGLSVEWFHASDVINVMNDPS